MMLLQLLSPLLFGGGVLCGVVHPQEDRLEAALETAAEEGAQDLKRVARQDDLFYPLPKHGGPPAPAHPPPHPATVYNAPPPPPPPSWPIKPPHPSVPCTPNFGITVSDGHFPIPHVPASYSASMPYISGYRLTPIIGQKQIVVNDVNHIPGPVPCLEPYQQAPPSYVQHLYTSSRQAEDFLRPFEQGGFFVLPPDTSAGLKSANEYQGKIEDLNNQVEHLESLKKNAIFGDHTRR